MAELKLRLIYTMEAEAGLGAHPLKHMNWRGLLPQSGDWVRVDGYNLPVLGRLFIAPSERGQDVALLLGAPEQAHDTRLLSLYVKSY